MELIVAFAIIVALLAILDFSAMKWGVDSRRTVSDWKPLPEADQFE